MGDKSKENAAEQPQEEAPKKKGGFFKRFIWFILILLIIWWFNNFTMKTTVGEITSDKIVNPIKIAVLSDYHADKFSISADTVVSRIEKEEPDIVFILGDMYTRKSSEDKIEIAVELMADIAELGMPVYFVPGEHDKDSFYFDMLIEKGIKVMKYKTENIQINENKLQIMGITNAYYSPTFDLSTQFENDNERYNIVLAHIPNYEKFADFGADLTLCGDTHGGMMQLPFGKGPVYHNGNWFPELSEEVTEEVYDKGFFRYKGGWMFITSGLGNNPVPARLNNRPEIAIIEIKPAKAK